MGDVVADRPDIAVKSDRPASYRSVDGGPLGFRRMARGSNELKLLGKFLASVALVCGLLAGVVAFDAAPAHAVSYDTSDVTVVTDQFLSQTSGEGYIVLDGIYKGQRGRYVIFFLSGNIYFIR